MGRIGTLWNWHADQALEIAGVYVCFVEKPEHAHPLVLTLV